MRKHLLPPIIVTLLLVACSSSAQSTDTPVLRQAQDEAAATDIHPTPTSTLAPTSPPMPTPLPTMTMTPTPTNAAPIISGLSDQSIADGVPEAMSEMYRLCPEPKELVSYDSSARGTDLFRSPYSDDLRQQLLDFLKDLAGRGR